MSCHGFWDHEYSSACPYVSPRHGSSQDPIFHPQTMSQRAPMERPSTDGGGVCWELVAQQEHKRLLLGRWGLNKKVQNNNWQWVDGGMLSVCVCVCAVRETARSSTIEISTCLHFCSGRILLRPLWRALTQLSRLTASERHPPAHKGPPRPSAEPWKGGKSKTEGMSEKKKSIGRGAMKKEKARERNEREERGWRAFSQRIVLKGRPFFKWERAEGEKKDKTRKKRGSVNFLCYTGQEHGSKWRDVWGEKEHTRAKDGEMRGGEARHRPFVCKFPTTALAVS